MTTIIISVLLALGIGGGVMVASSGGSSGGGAAVVTPSNPSGGGGGSGGGSTGGGNTGGNTGGSTGGSTTNPSLSNAISMANSTISFSGDNSSIKTGGILASAPSSTTLISKVSSASLKNGKITMQINMFAPTLVAGTTNTYTTNETYSTINLASGTSLKFMSGYKPTNPAVSVDFNLTSILSSSTEKFSNYADRYSGTLPATRTLPKLEFKYINSSSGETSLGFFENVTWKVNTMNLFLGGRKLGLENSDFGFTEWIVQYSHPDIDSRRLWRRDIQPLYIFDASSQLKSNEYKRYTNNTATFNGKVIGKELTMQPCGNNEADYLAGNISITLNFDTQKLSGALSNMKTVKGGNEGNFGRNPSFEGEIYSGASNTPNFKITSVGNYSSINADGTFGQGFIVKGDTVAKDEVVGDLSFAYNNGSIVTNLTFGAKKQ